MPSIIGGAKVLKQSESGNDFKFIKRFKAYFVIVKFGSFKNSSYPSPDEGL